MVASVDERLLDIVGGVKLRRLLRRSLGGGLGIVAGKNAAVLGLDRPEASLVIHFGSGVLSDASDQVGVASAASALHLRRHCRGFGASVGCETSVEAKENQTLILKCVL